MRVVEHFKPLTIPGAPVTKKNSQRVFRRPGPKGTPFIVPSQQYKFWEERAVWHLRNQWRREAISTPVNMKAIVYRAVANGDLLNFLAAVSDALEAAHVVENDRLIVAVDGSRLDKDDANPRVEILLENFA